MVGSKTRRKQTRFLSENLLENTHTHTDVLLRPPCTSDLLDAVVACRLLSVSADVRFFVDDVIAFEGHLEEHCPDVKLDEIEWKTEVERAVIPYGLLVRVWPKGNDPHADAYSSPQDQKTKWWAVEEAKNSSSCDARWRWRWRWRWRLESC